MDWKLYKENSKMVEWQIKHSNDDRSELMIEQGVQNLWFVTFKPKDFIPENLGEFPNKLQAIAFAKNWMKKHPKGY